MSHPSPLPATVADMIQEAHLRLAVLLDLIDDELTAGVTITARLTQLRAEYDHHALGQEQMLAAHLPHLLAEHRHDHDHMRALLGQLGHEYACGADIRPALRQVVGMFTDRLMPQDAVFHTLPKAPLSLAR